MIKTTAGGGFNETEMAEMSLRFEVQQYLHDNGYTSNEQGADKDISILHLGEGKILAIDIIAGSLRRLEIGETHRQRYADGSAAPKYAVEFPAPGTDITTQKTHRDKKYLTVSESRELPEETGEELWQQTQAYSSALFDIITSCLKNGATVEAEPFVMNRLHVAKLVAQGRAERIARNLAQLKGALYGIHAHIHASTEKNSLPRFKAPTLAKRLIKTSR